MAITLVTTQTIIARNAGALYNVSIGSTLMNSLVAQASVSTSSTDALLNQVYVQSVGTTPTTSVAATLIANLGITGATAVQQATDYIVAVLNANSPSFRGAAVNDLLDLFVGLTNDANFGAAAKAYNAKVANAEAYALVAGNVANVGFSAVTSDTTVGTTFTLTKSVQASAGTSGNDTFIAGDEGGSATLNAGDQITGGAGTDTLKLFNATGALNAANFALATITGVENVEATFSATAQTLNVSGNAEVKQVTVANGFDGNVTLTKAQTAGISGAVASTAAVTFSFTDVTGGADTANLVVNAADLTTTGTVKGVTMAGVETLNIAATGTNDLGDLLAVAMTKMVVTGAGSLKTTLTGTATKTIDGSAATGNLTINNAAAAAAVQSIKTGSGNDTYTTKAADLTGDDVIEMGTGTDSLRFTDAATFNDATTKATLAKVTGVEQLGIVTTATTLTVDGDFVSQTSYYVAGATANAALTNIANNADITFGKTDIVANATGINTIGMKLGANTLNVNLDGAKDGASVVGGVVLTSGDGLAVTGSATINVKSTGTDGQPNNVLDLTAADNQSVVITGSQNLTLTTKAAIATTGFSIDGSAFTGKLTVTGTAASDIVKGGSGNDIISGGAGAAISDTLTGGAGADKFIVIAGVTAATADVITDFVTKTDTISFGAAVLAANYTEGTAAVADFAAALAAANVVLTNAGGTKQVNVQQVGADSWVFYNDGGASGADQVVKLTGVAFAGIEAADIVA